MRPSTWYTAIQIVLEAGGFILSICNRACCIFCYCALMFAASAYPEDLSHVKQVGTGEQHTCALMQDGTVQCWGDNSFGQLGDDTTTSHALPYPVVGLTNAADLIVNGFRSCAIVAGGTMYCWGDGIEGELGNGISGNIAHPVKALLPTAVLAAATGRNHTCALLADNTVACWGSNASGQVGLDPLQSAQSLTPNTLQFPSGFVPMKLVAGQEHNCVLAVDGRVACWGNLTGYVPQLVQGLGSAVVTSLSAGGNHDCALISDGSALCWGGNDGGQLGDGSTTDSSMPVLVQLPSGQNVVSLSSGDSHTCALTETAAVVCWGSNRFAQVGSDSGNIVAKPIVVADLDGIAAHAVSVATGFVDSCALVDDGTVRCWGAGQFGQLGRGSLPGEEHTAFSLVSVLPSPVPTVAVAGGLASGEAHTCAITATAKVVCWGENGSGQLGIGTTMNHSAPVIVPSIVNTVVLTAGTAHTCAAVNGGTSVTCWGSNDAGQLGNGTQEDQLDPGSVSGFPAPGRTVKALSAGGSSTCALLDNSSVWCWGLVNSAIETVPKAVKDLPPPGQTIIAITQDSFHVCVLIGDGSVRCWGDNGVDADYPTPTQIAGLTDATAIASASNTTCAVRAAGGAACWGSNFGGLFGNGTLDSSLAAVPVDFSGLPPGRKVTGIAMGGVHACARIDDGSAMCWSSNSSGELGNGTLGTDSLVPVRVHELTDATMLTAGTNHTCAIRNGGLLACWGENFFGQLGNGASFQLEPLPVLDGELLFRDGFEG